MTEPVTYRYRADYLTDAAYRDHLEQRREADLARLGVTIDELLDSHHNDVVIR